MNDEEKNVFTKDPKKVAEEQNTTMMQLDDVSFAVLAFMRTYSRPDTNPGLIFENGKYLLGHLEALTLSMKQIVEKYESLR